MISALPVEGLPEITEGFDLAAAVVSALGAQGEKFVAGDVLVMAHKAISKREGRVRRLADVVPGEQAVRIAAEQEKDPRHVQVVLDESRAVLRAVGGVLITETHHGFICANSGVDASNVPGDDSVVMLPVDPDGSARALRARLLELTGIAVGVVITDSFGRAWRIGQCDIAIGCAGIEPVEDWRGGVDSQGRELRATVIAVADQLAALADMARRKDGQQPAVLVRGADLHVLTAPGAAGDGPGAVALIRAPEQDLFR